MSWDMEHLTLHYGEQGESLEVVTVSEDVTCWVARALQPEGFQIKNGIFEVGSTISKLQFFLILR